MVFGAKESQLAYSIHGLKQGMQSDFLQAFLHLIQLGKTRFAKEEVLKLFSFRSFADKWGFSVEDVHTVSRWIGQAKIRWGWDQEDRKSALSSQAAEEMGTWVYGLDRLLWGLAMVAQEDFALKATPPVWPCSCVDLAEVDLLEKMIGILTDLHKDSEALKNSCAIGTWLDQWDYLARKYLSFEGQDFFLQEIDQLKKNLSHLKEEIFTAQSAERIIEHVTAKIKGACYPPHLQQVTFGSLIKGCYRPAKVIWLLGMDEGSFPRLDKKHSLCEIDFSSEYIPQKREEDRYLFLQHLTLAETAFFMSYERVNPEDNKEQGPSLVVQELVQYCQLAYQIDPAALTVEHPFLPFDAAYFSQNSRHKSYLPRLFKEAQAHYGVHESMPPFIDAKQPKRILEDGSVIEIQKLAALARNPIKFYLQQSLGIYMAFEDDEASQEFVLSNLQKRSLRAKAVRGPLDPYLSMWRAKGELPTGTFYQVAIDQLNEEREELLQSLKKSAFVSEPIVTVSLSLACHTPIQHSEFHWIVPALKIPLSEERSVWVTGKLDHVTTQGLLVDAEDEIGDWVKCWPLFLVYLSINLFSEKKKKAVLLTKAGKYKEGAFENPLQLLCQYLLYFERALNEISPLMPTWAEAFFSTEEKDFIKKVCQVGDDEFAYADHYMLWLKRRQAFPDPKQMLDSWRQDLESLFQPMRSAWEKQEQIDAEV